MENCLRDIDPEIAIPYIDWTLDNVLGNEDANSFDSVFHDAKRSGTLAVDKDTGTCPGQSPVAWG